MIFLEKSLFSVSSSLILVFDITNSCFKSLISASYGVVGGAPEVFFFCLTFAAVDSDDIEKTVAEGFKPDRGVDTDD